MPIWKLEPLDPDHADWEASTHTGPAVVRAPNAVTARAAAALVLNKGLREPAGAQTDVLPISPWRFANHVRAEAVEASEWPEDGPVADVLACWRHGSVIRSWLVELMERQYRDKGGLEPVPPYVEDTGEVNRLVDDALHLEVPVPVIARSVMQLFASCDDKRNWARSIALMRHGFGGHPLGADADIAEERHEGRVGGVPAPDGTEDGS